MLFRFLEKVTDNREEKEEGEGFWKLAKKLPFVEKRGLKEFPRSLKN